MTKTLSLQYWPEVGGESKTFENYTIKAVDVEVTADYVKTELDLTNLAVWSH